MKYNFVHDLAICQVQTNNGIFINVIPGARMLRIVAITLIAPMTDEIPIKCTVAMTGEITLRGEVTAIGGLKEKLLAALRGGIETVLIPEENVKDLTEIPDNVKNGLEIIPVKWIDQVLKVALEREPEPLSEAQIAAAAAARAAATTTESKGAAKH